MATRTVFTDENSNEMECYLNDKGSLLIKVGEPGESFENNGYITLDKEDVNKLIKILTEIESEMEY